MLALLRAFETCAAPPTDGAAAFDLPPEDRDALRDLEERIESDVARPFFRVADVASVDEGWDAWVEWFRPLVAELARRMLPLVQAPEASGPLLRSFTATVDEAADRLGALSPELERTFRAAVATGLRSDLAGLTSRHGSSVASRGAPGGPALDPALLTRLERASIGFGLAFLLSIETLERASADRERLRFLVLKLKRHSAVVWACTRRLLAATRTDEAGPHSPGGAEAGPPRTPPCPPHGA